MDASPRVTAFPRITELLAVGALIALAIGDVHAQSSPHTYPYDGVADWARLPEGRVWGAPTGVDIDPDGTSVWVLERCGDFNGPGCAESNLAPVLEFDASGRLVKSFGAGMFLFPHGIALDRQGNVYVTDGRGAEGKGHQVFKFSPNGEVLLTLGQPGVAGEGHNTLNRPSDVAIAPNGDIFVADGHSGMDTNMRIVKYSPDGKYIKEWGHKGSAPGELDGAHGLAFDASGRLFVADRENNRIEIFDQDGNYVDAWTQFGTPSGLYITPDDVLYVADYGIGIRIGSARDGTVTGLIRATAPAGATVRVAESVAVDRNGVVYGGENANKQLVRLALPR
jgi:DNA-binding beta-propeller fold protein YncE